MKKIAILGSTGSIGTQALDIIAKYPDRFSVAALSCSKSLDLLKQQIELFKPAAVCVAKPEDAAILREFFSSSDYKDSGLDKTEFLSGMEGLKAIASMDEADMVLNSLVGMLGLEPTLAAIEAGKDIAFANKETLVVGGEPVMEAVHRKGVKLLPVDSEHSAIFQSLQGNEGNEIRRILLTASGGPFRGFTREELEGVTLEQALNHPNWSMGSKITIDSATLMNKGFEVIEAKWLFDVPLEKVQVVVHPESVLHSAVEYMDGSVVGQMGNPDMRVPIGYAFSYPERLDLSEMKGSTGLATDGTGTEAVTPLDLFACKGLNFCEPDREVFKTIDLAYEAAREGGSYPVVLNGANEVLVAAFLKGEIRFVDIQDTLERVMASHRPVKGLDIKGILEIDRLTRKHVRDLVSR